jgi:predicted nucleotide-binding protein
MSGSVSKQPTTKPKQQRISQSDVPSMPISGALKIANALWDNFAGQPTAPHMVAMALDLSPTSGGWRMLCGASIAYGLTEGGYNANEISLTELGHRVVAPTEEGDDVSGLREAVLKPRLLNEFFTTYNRAKLPRDDIAVNVLVSKGIPKEKAKLTFATIKENGSFAGFIQETKTGPFVALDMPAPQLARQLEREPEEDISHAEADQPTEVQTPVTSSESSSVQSDKSNNRVFITHGKDHSAIEQIKEVVELGGFEPVVSVQTESLAKPIPQKVLDDMRSCGAAIIHVSKDQVFEDIDGNEHVQLNPNVLIEIGAAMALYEKRFILVVEDGVKLPSNLSGLYESRYQGQELSFSAGMKILKALRGLKEETP